MMMDDLKIIKSLGVESLYNNIISNKQTVQLWIMPAFFQNFPTGERAVFSSIQLRVAVSWKFQSKILHTVGLSVTSSVTVVVPLRPSEHSAILLGIRNNLFLLES